MNQLYDPLADAAETARAVWQDLATVDPPVSVSERLDAVLEAHTMALDAAGCLVRPRAVLDGDDYNRFAIDLARRSGAPRYWGGEQDGVPNTKGWRMLRQHWSDIENAYKHAIRQVKPGEENLLVELADLRSILLRVAATPKGNDR